MHSETNVCYFCKRLVTFTEDKCPKCHKEKRFIFEQQLKERETSKGVDKQNKSVQYTKWEYTRVKSPSDRDLKKLGLIGWELVAIHPIQVEDHNELIHHYIFKRMMQPGKFM